MRDVVDVCKASLLRTVGSVVVALGMQCVHAQGAPDVLIPHTTWDCGMPDGIPTPEAGTLAFEIENLLTQRGQSVIASTCIIEFGCRPLAGFCYQPVLNKPLQRAVKGGRPEAHFAFAAFENVVHDRIAVSLAFDEGDEDVKPIAL